MRLIAQNEMKKMKIEELKSNIKTRYRNGPDNIGKDFVTPCLQNSKLYRRGTGFFSSSALAAYAEAMDSLLKEDLKIQILCSPIIHDQTLIKTLEKNQTKEQKALTIKNLGTKIILDAIGYQLDSKNKLYRNHLLAYLLAKNILEVRIAILNKTAEHLAESFTGGVDNIYHVKTGYFILNNEEIIAFDGSFNETDSGHSHHIENVQVLRGWEPHDSERVKITVADVNDDWEGRNPFITTHKIDKDTLEIIKNIAPQHRPEKTKNNREEEQSQPDEQNETENKNETGLRYYQKEALNQWAKSDHKGIIALATGTGKTKTAIAAIGEFKKKYSNGLVIITVPYVPLAKQWSIELSKAGIATIDIYDSREDWISKLNNILYAHDKKIQNDKIPALICVNKTFKGNSFQSTLDKYTSSEGERLIIVDECHHFNTKEQINKLPERFQYRMGLSATPYEPQEERILEKYFTKNIYEYTIKEAIKDKYLTPYEYHPIFIELTKTEVETYLNLIRQYNNVKLIDGQFEDVNNILEKIDRLLETVAAKLIKLEQMVKQTGPENLTLFYCGEGYINIDGERTRQIDTVTQILYENGWKVGKITSMETQSNRATTLENFKNQNIHAIASMRVLDEGIDVPNCTKAYILASQRRVRQCIQRRGRILRLNKDKLKATLLDFIIVGPELSDEELRRLYSREMQRAIMFANDALNSEECLARLKLQ